MNTITIDEQLYTEDDIRNLIHLTRELLIIKDDQNAKLIAFNAKLQNEEKKVKELQQKLFFLSQAFTQNTFEA
jgi:hypothetical protein